MLYTARPLEKIYAQPSVFDQNKKENEENKEIPEYRDVILPNGRLRTRRDGENYIIEGIYSTNMSDYLNEEYFPGQNYKG